VLISKSESDKFYTLVKEAEVISHQEYERLLNELEIRKDSKEYIWINQLSEDQKAFFKNETKIENETFSEFLERYYKKEFSKKTNAKPTTKTKDILYRNIGSCTPDELVLKSDREIYELVKYQLLHLTRGTRKSEAGEVEYLKNLLKELRK